MKTLGEIYAEVDYLSLLPATTLRLSNEAFKRLNESWDKPFSGFDVMRGWGVVRKHDLWFELNRPGAQE